MKFLFALIGISIGIITAAPSYAEPGIDEPASDENNGQFLADLTKVGINYGDPQQAVSAGQSVCGFIARGVPGLELIDDLKAQNPTLTESGARQFATISAKSYCPAQLEPRRDKYAAPEDGAPVGSPNGGSNATGSDGGPGAGNTPGGGGNSVGTGPTGG